MKKLILKSCLTAIVMVLAANVWAAEGPAFDENTNNVLRKLGKELEIKFKLYSDSGSSHLQCEETEGKLILRDRGIELTFGGASDNFPLLQITNRKTKHNYISKPSLGNIFSNIQLVKGYKGTGAKFDGTNSAVNIPSHPSLKGITEGPVTIDFRLYMDKLPEKGEICIIGFAAPSFTIFTKPQGGLYAYLITEEQPSHIAVAGGLTIKPDQWHHVRFSYDGKSKISWFLDGATCADEASTKGRIKISNGDYAMVIGRYNANNDLPHFKGIIDELWIAEGLDVMPEAGAEEIAKKSLVYLPFDDSIPAKIPIGGDPLWSLELSGPKGEKQTVNSTAPAECTNYLHKQTILTVPEGHPVRKYFWRYSMNLVWDKVKVPWSKGSLKVTAVCTLWNGYDGESRWNISVENSSDDIAIETINFPQIALACDEKHPEKDYFTTNFGWGQVHPNPLNSNLDKWSYQGFRYPSSVHPLQFHSFYHEGEEASSGIYLATHDGAGYTKNFYHQPNKKKRQIDFAMVFDVPDGIKCGKDAAIPYDAVIAVFEGDWYDAAQIYRKWALQQIWCCKGPLYQRQDMPKWFIEHAGGFNLWLRPKEAPQTLKPFADALTARPLVFGYWNWAVPTHCKDVPHVPFAEGLPESIKQLHDMGYKLIPYIDVRLWDRGNGDWPAYKDYAVQERNGQVQEENDSFWKPGFAVMCPACAPFHKRTAEVVQSIQHVGFDGVYMDQITASPPSMCYNPEHGHSLGGGTYWVDGFRALLKEIRYRTDNNGKYFVLTSESSPETWMDLIDGNYIASPMLFNNVPIFAAIYGGYTVSYGGGLLDGRDGKKAFVMAFGQHFIFGGATSLASNSKIYKILDTENADMLEFINRIGQLRVKGLPYLAYGRMLRPLKYKNTLPEVAYFREVPKEEIDPDIPQPDIQERLPAVINTVWESPEGKIGVVLLNISREPQEVVFDLGQATGGTTKLSKKAKLTKISGSEKVTSKNNIFTVKLDALDGAILEIDKKIVR